MTSSGLEPTHASYLTRHYSAINFLNLNYFDSDIEPVSSVFEHDNFAAVFTGVIEIKIAGSYSFSMINDDGAKVWIDGTEILDIWRYSPSLNYGVITLSVGTHNLKALLA